MHASTFEYHAPDERQQDAMSVVRQAAASYAQTLDLNIPEGPDKTYLMRKLREVATWANVAITRQPDGTPR